MLRYLFTTLALLTAAVSPAQQAEAKTKLAQATFAGGCFWCVEYDLDMVPGVVSTTSGFTGGHLRNPSYQQVSAGGTGHYEAVRVIYDPTRLSYAELVRRFLRTIDPLDSGGQFCDRGAEYRTALFVQSESERQVAAAAKVKASRELGAKVATEILRSGPFWPAEAAHQDYYKKNPVKYRYYRFSCGRDARVAKVWGRAVRQK